MSEDFKPVSDRTLNDVNRANRDAWDSGEFKHQDAEVPGLPSEKALVAAKERNRIRKEGEVTKSATRFKPPRSNPYGNNETANHPDRTSRSGEDSRHPKTGGQQVVGEGGKVIVHAHDETDGWPESASRAAEKGAPFKQAVGPLTKAQAEYGEKRKKDLRSIGINPTEGEHMNRRAIIARHPQNDDQPEGATSKRQVHMPRTRKRTWRKGEWS